jgi:hypothetical protein
MRFKTQAVKVRLKDDVFNKAGQYPDRHNVRGLTVGVMTFLKVLSSYFTADGHQSSPSAEKIASNSTHN